jgi:hypothetical protein
MESLQTLSHPVGIYISLDMGSPDMYNLHLTITFPDQVIIKLVEMIIIRLVTIEIEPVQVIPDEIIRFIQIGIII